VELFPHPPGGHDFVTTLVARQGLFISAGDSHQSSLQFTRILAYNREGSPSLAKTNKFLRTKNMRVKMAAKTSLNCSVIEGAKGIRAIKFAAKGGKIVRLV
jgi:hypothetical protein